MTTEQHKRILRFNTLEARRIASRLLRGMDPEDVEDLDDTFAFDGWYNGTYWAIHVMGDKGRLRYPEGHPNAGNLIPGHFIIMAWQGPLSEAPAQLRDNVITQAQIDAVFPDGQPEFMG